MSHSVNQIQDHLWYLANKVAALNETMKTYPPGDPMRAKTQKEIQWLRQCITHFNSEHRRLTGAVYVMSVDGGEIVGHTPEAKRAAEQQQQKQRAKTEGMACYRRLTGMLQELRLKAQSAWEHLTENLFLGMMLPQAGGGSITDVSGVNTIVIPRAEKALNLAGERLSTGAVAKAEVHLTEAAKLIQCGFERLGEHENAMAAGAARVEAAIKIGAAAGTGMAAAGTELSTFGTMAVESTGAAAQEATLLGAKALGGEQVTSKDLSESLLNVLVSGESALVGKVGARLLGPLGARLLFKGRPSKAQLELVRNSMEAYFAGSSKQLIEYGRKLQRKEPVSDEFLAALILPALQGPASRAGKALEEKDVRELIRSMVK